MLKKYKSPKWMSYVLKLAGVYSIFWGLFLLVFPNTFSQVINVNTPKYAEIWQCISIFSIVFGIGYLIASTNPVKHYVIILIGFLTKLLLAFLSLKLFLFNGFSTNFIFHSIVTDVIWLLPFSFILKEAYHFYNEIKFQIENNPQIEFEKVLKNTETNLGISLYEQSFIAPTMLIFLRHFGCTFCRETIKDLCEVSNAIESNGTEIVLVHMNNNNNANEILQKYNFENAITISDKNQELYKAFKLDKGNLFQLFGFKVLTRAFWSGFINGNGVGKPESDYAQMPGVFVIYKSKVIKCYRHRSVADRPNYLKIADCDNAQLMEL